MSLPGRSLRWASALFLGALLSACGDSTVHEAEHSIHQDAGSRKDANGSAHDAGGGGSGGGGVLGEAGRGDAAFVPPDASDAATGDDAKACAARAVSGLRLYEVAVLQGVKIPIMERLADVTERNADVVADRAALVRAYVFPLPEFRPRRVRARLTLSQDGAGSVVREDAKVISAESSDAALDSTFDFTLDAASVRPGTRYAIELLEDGCDAPDGGSVGSVGARFPEAGTSDLGVRVVGGVRVRLVPIRFTVRGKTLSPDTSPAEIERYRKTLHSLFPVSSVELTVREQPIDAVSNDVRDLLDQITALRDGENDDRLLSYYGMVRLTDQRSEYCSPSCVLGAGVVGESPEAGGGSAVGVDYSDDESAHTFAHELGHVYGSAHSPCNVPGDPLYPYRAGSIGSWGWDLEGQTLKDPGTYKDLMGYCSPVWISDYVYGHLQSYLIAAASPPAPPGSDAGIPLDAGAADAGTVEPPDGAAGDGGSAAQPALEASGDFLTLLVEPGAPSRWAARRRVKRVPGGIRETADVLGRDGRVVDSVSVRRVRALDVAREYVYVPAPTLGASWSIRLRGQPPQPYRFSPMPSSTAAPLRNERPR